MASSVSERRDRAHLSCATIPLVTPRSYRRGRLLLWVFGVEVPARWRDLPNVVLALGQVVFHLAGSLGDFLIFAAPDPGGC